MAETIFKVSKINSPTPTVIYSDWNAFKYESSADDILYNAEAVANHIMNLLMTDIGECDFEPTLGSRLSEMKFHLPNDYTKWGMNGDIITTFKTWETDVYLLPKYTDFISYPDSAEYVIQIGVRIRSLNVSNLTITLEDSQ